MKKYEEEKTEILNSLQFVNQLKTPFKTPQELIQLLFNNCENLNPENLILKASHETQISENNEMLTAYGRLILIDRIEVDNELSFDVGFITSYEQKKPFIKVFTGFNVKACLNLCVFNAKDKEQIFLNHAEHDYKKAAEIFSRFLQEREQKIKTYLAIKRTMENTFLNRIEVQNFFGQMLFNFSGEIKNPAGINAVTNGAKQLLTNPLYKSDNIYNCWSIYNALTYDYNDNTHLIDHPEKVLAIFNEMLKIKDFTNLQTPLPLEYNENIQALN